MHFVIYSSPTSQELLWRVLKMHFVILFQPAKPRVAVESADDAFCYIIPACQAKDAVELMMHFVVYSSLPSQKML